jgi:hypothetical protein
MNDEPGSPSTGHTTRRYPFAVILLRRFVGSDCRFARILRIASVLSLTNSAAFAWSGCGVVLTLPSGWNARVVKPGKTIEYSQWSPDIHLDRDAAASIVRSARPQRR